MVFLPSFVSRFIYTLTKLYVWALVVLSVVILAWIVGVFEPPSIRTGGIWLAFGGAGALILISLLHAKLSGSDWDPARD